MSKNSESNLDYKYILLLKQLNIYLNHFPKFEKFGITLKIRQSAYDLYELIIECQKRYNKKTTLTLIDIKHEQLRMFIRLANELGYFDYKNEINYNNGDNFTCNRKYLILSNMIDEIGKMIGGWLKVNLTKENII